MDLRKHAPEASKSPLGIMGLISIILAGLFLIGYLILAPENLEVATEAEQRRQLFLFWGGSFLACMGSGILLFHVARDPHFATGADPALREKLAGASLAYRVLLLPRVFLAHRRARGFLNAALQIVLGLALFVLANYLFARHELWRIDLTKSQVFSLSEESRLLVGRLEQPVRILTILPESTNERDRNLLREIKTLAAQYREASSRIEEEFFDTLSERDPVARERRLAELGVTGDLNDAALMGVIVQLGRRGPDGSFRVEQSKRLSTSDLWAGDPSDPTGRRTFFSGERAISGAILELLDDDQPVLYFLSGHGEASIGDMDPQGLAFLVERLRERNFSVKTLNLLEEQAPAVPEDADLLVVAGPRSPLTKSEIDAVGLYLKGGGDMLYFAEPRYEPVVTTGSLEWIDTGLETLVRDRYGIFCQDQIVFVLGTDARGRRAKTADLAGAFLDYRPRHPISLPLAGSRVWIRAARSLKRIPVLNCVTEDLLGSREGYDGQYEAQADPRSPQRGAPGPFSLAMAAEAHDATGKTGPKKPSRVVVVGDLDFATTALLGNRSYTNLEFLLNTVQWCIERQERVIGKVPVKDPTVLIMTREQVIRVELLAFPGLPLIAIALGILAWAIRRRSS